jgi:hypothetical protein
LCDGVVLRHEGELDHVTGCSLELLRAVYKTGLSSNSNLAWR